VTTYFCWKCKTKDHWANDDCPRDAAPQVVAGQLSNIGSSRRLVTQPAAEPAVAAPIKQARDFIDKVRKVGRPRTYPDPKVRRREYSREYMRKRRAKYNLPAN